MIKIFFIDQNASVCVVMQYFDTDKHIATVTYYTIDRRHFDVGKKCFSQY